MRYYVTTTDPDTGELMVIQETAGMPRVTPFGETKWMESVPQDTAQAVTQEELLAFPGGADALERFRNGDDSAYHRYCRAVFEKEDQEAERNERLTDDELFATFVERLREWHPGGRRG